VQDGLPKVLYNNLPPLSDATSDPAHALYCPKYDKNHHNDDNYLAAPFCKQIIRKHISMKVTADNLLQECSCFQNSINVPT
jgi:hypothetical protein